MVSEYAHAAEISAPKDMGAAVVKTGLGLITLASLLKDGGTGNAEADAILKQIRDLAARLNEVAIDGGDSEDLVANLDEGVPENLFDDLVADLKGRETSAINNEGFEAQLSYIVQALGFKRASEVVQNHLCNI